MELGGVSGAKHELAAKQAWRRLEGGSRRLGLEDEGALRKHEGALSLIKFDQFSPCRSG